MASNSEREENASQKKPSTAAAGRQFSLSFRTFGRLLPYFWRWRWLFLVTFLCMTTFSVSVTLRNILPAVLFDGVLVPDSGNSKITAWVEPALDRLGFPSETPDFGQIKGTFRDLRVTGITSPAEDIEAGLLDGRVTVQTSQLNCDLILPGTEVFHVENFPTTEVTAWNFDSAQARWDLETKTLELRGGIVEAARTFTSLDRSKMSFLKFLCVFGVAICILIAGSRFAQRYLEGRIIQNVLADMRRDLIDHMCNLDVGFFSMRSRGDLLSRISTDLAVVSNGMNIFFGDLIQKPITFVVAVVGLFWMKAPLAAVVVPLFIPLFFIILRFGKKVRRRSRKQSQSRGLMTEALEQLFSGIRTVKSFRMEEFEKEHFEEKNRGVVRQALRTLIAKTFSAASVEFASHFGVMLVLGIGGYFLIQGSLDMTVGELFVFVAFLNQMYLPIKSAARAYSSLQESLGGMERVTEIFETETQVIEASDATTLEPFKNGIRFENVSFRYDRDPVLENVTLDFPVGTLTAIVGPTGAGKTTLVDLILRFYDPIEGRILIDDTDIKSVTLESLLAQISIVSQDPFLFDTTIANNIRYGRPGASQEDIEAAARAANVHEDIISWPDSYETHVGDRGDLLSGGQRQRITIARSLLKNTPILILDEATSNLDSESEAAVKGALEKLMAVRSTIAIAHRLSTIKSADNIVVLEAGRIVEQGTFEELLQREGLFYRLYRTQSFGLATQG